MLKLKSKHVQNWLNTERLQLIRILKEWPEGYNEEKKQRKIWLDDINKILENIE